MTITFCLIPSIPSGVLRECSGFNHFLNFSLNYENKLLDMKNYSCSWPISYDVIILINYFPGQRNNLTILKFLILRGVGFTTDRVFRTSHIMCK